MARAARTAAASAALAILIHPLAGARAANPLPPATPARIRAA
jgi:hypothetical protein